MKINSFLTEVNQFTKLAVHLYLPQKNQFGGFAKRIRTSLLLVCASTMTYLSHGAIQSQPMVMYTDNQRGTGYYSSADEACAATVGNSPSYIQSSGRVEYAGSKKMGCEHTWIDQQGRTIGPHFYQNHITAVEVCPSSNSYNGNFGCISTAPQNGSSCLAGNPVDVATGTKRQTELDFSLPNTSFPLHIQRSYTSRSFIYQRTFGHGWFIEPYGFKLKNHKGYGKISVYRGPEQRWMFVLNRQTGEYLYEDDKSLSLFQKEDTWVLKGGTYDEERYNDAGQLIQINHNDNIHQLIYSDEATPSAIAPEANLLIRITDANQHSLNLIYDDEALLKKVTLDGVDILTYAYADLEWSGSRNLRSVTFEDGRTREYLYKAVPESTTTGIAGAKDLGALGLVAVGGVRNLNSTIIAGRATNAASYIEGGYSVAPLTGIIDENGVRYATWQYDDKGRVISSEHSDGAEKTQFEYHNDDSTSTTNALGKKTTYSFSDIGNQKKVTKVEGHASTHCVAANTSTTYTALGYIESQTDWSGNKTRYTRNAKGQETQRTEASGTPEARTVTTEWHATLNRPTKITDTERTTHYTYDEAGRILTQRVVADNQERISTYTYTPQGLLASIDGPRTDVADITRYAYNAQGNLTQVTNALNHLIQFGDYDAHNRPQLVTDENGTKTQLRYYPRGWLKSSTVLHQGNATNDLVTSYVYDGLGQLTQMTSPDGQITRYEYDNARRLVAIINHLGERQGFVLDAAGNPTQETLKNASGALVYHMTRQYDELSRVMKLIGAANQSTQITYDSNDNPTAITNGRGFTHSADFDALNRVKKALDPLLADTQFDYNSDDQLTSVTDARGLKTDYVYNGFGELIQQTSPDTGTQHFEYDSAGNRIKRTDARGVITHYRYDALNRLTQITYPASPLENRTFTYDTGPTVVIGRMTKTEDSFGYTEYFYNYLGKMVQKAYGTGTKNFVINHFHDQYARVNRVFYPSGRIVHYTYDSLSRIHSITTQANANAPVQTVVSDVRYLPFGPVSGWQFGNGITHTLSYDQDYRLSAQKTEGTSTLIDNTFAYDANNNLTAINDQRLNPASQQFVYTEVDRVKTAEGVYGDLAYDYDVVGNRTLRTHTKGAQTTTETYHYSPLSQRLDKVTSNQAGERNFGYDTNGNIISDIQGLVKSWIYNNQNRPSSVKVGANNPTFYIHNYLGQRVYKKDDTHRAYYHYDDAGQLIAVSDHDGVFTEEHIWLYNQQVATLRSSKETH